MSDLVATAQRLRDVKESMRHFLELWALEPRGGGGGGGGAAIADIDTADVEAAIRQELDVSISESLVRGVLAEE